MQGSMEVSLTTPQKVVIETLVYVTYRSRGNYYYAGPAKLIKLFNSINGTYIQPSSMMKTEIKHYLERIAKSFGFQVIIRNRRKNGFIVAIDLTRLRKYSPEQLRAELTRAMLGDGYVG